MGRLQGAAIGNQATLSWLAADPVIHLDLKHVRGPVAEDRAPLGAKIEIAIGIVSGPALCPNEEHGRARPILPPHHGVADERPEGEVRVSERKSRRWASAIGIHRVSGTAR